MPKEKSGILKKRGGVRHNWLERKFILKDGSLSYYANGVFKGSVPTIFITECRSTFPDTGNRSDKKQPFRFEFYAKTPSEKKGRTYFLSASTEDERNEWISALTSWIGYSDENTAKQGDSGVTDVESSTSLPAATDDAEKQEQPTSKRDDDAKDNNDSNNNNNSTATTTDTTNDDSNNDDNQSQSDRQYGNLPGATKRSSSSDNVATAAADDTDNNAAATDAPAVSDAGSLRIHEEPVDGTDGSVRIVCEGGDAEAVAKAAQEAAAEYARKHGAVALDPGFYETDRKVERIETPLGFDEVTIVTATDGKGTIKTYTNTVSIQSKT